MTIALHPIANPGADFDAAARLFDRYRQFYGQAPAPDVSRAFLLDRLAKRESVVLLARVAGAPAGFVQLYPGFSSIACRPTMTLNDLFVEAACRSAGVGRRLVEAAIDIAVRSGASALTLETAVDNLRAQRLYERFGFVRSCGFHTYALELAGRGEGP
jgi:ribosomal protein S18 acetylase RimI-like enzyme